MATVKGLIYQLILLLLIFTAACTSSQEVNCSSDFFLMEQSLLKCTENRFNLLKAFFPPRQAHPVLVKVSYTFDDTNASKIWFWSESEFYLIQPLEVFQFSSLFFSIKPYRQSQLQIKLDGNCTLASHDYFELLTTRVSASE